MLPILPKENQTRLWMERMLHGAILVCSVMASWWAGSRLSYTYDLPRISPRPAAFSVWILLYALLLGRAAIPSETPAAMLLTSASLLVTVVWTLLEDGMARVASLAISTFLASVAASKTSEDVDLPVDLYAAWLSVATMLSLATAVPALDHPPPHRGLICISPHQGTSEGF